MDPWVRIALLGALLVAAVASARPRPAAVVVAIGSEELRYFAPEIARALSAELARSSLDRAAAAEAVAATTLAELGGDRVRLSCRIRGRVVEVEGAVEELDLVTAQLAGHLIELLDQGKPRAGRVSREAHPARMATGGSGLPEGTADGWSGSQPKPGTGAIAAGADRASTLDAGLTTPLATPPGGASAAKESRADGGEESAALAAKGSPSPAGDSRADTVPVSGRLGAPASGARPTAALGARATAQEASELLEPYAAAPHAPWGTVRGRVVAHAIADPPNSYAGAGRSATQALYSFLSSRMRLTVVPTGMGISSAAAAQNEAFRAGARAVVMARIDSLQFYSSSRGPTVRARIQLDVLRDGRAVLRRTLYSALTDPGRQGRQSDPVYQAVWQTLEAEAPQLQRVLGGIR